jgi:hypothetical protein
MLPCRSLWIGALCHFTCTLCLLPRLLALVTLPVTLLLILACLSSPRSFLPTSFYLGNYPKSACNQAPVLLEQPDFINQALYRWGWGDSANK